MLEIQTKQLPPDITVLGLTGRITIGPGLQGIGMGRREPGERGTKKSYFRPDRDLPPESVHGIIRQVS
jgi:hypothetical protein